MPDVVACFPESVAESGSVIKLLYCLLYLLATVLLTGFGFYLYFHHLVNHIKRKYRHTLKSFEDESVELKEIKSHNHGHSSNK
ncbi:MAG TPA: hypothetical protein VJU13_03375 [Candidatus Nitrosocosmicus sp.]|nr:hypothetical protein [Candidatus Nitrosocosmicus sp.]